MNISCLISSFEVAYQEALLANNENEVPVGACIVINNQIITSARNKIIQKKDPTAHAEIEAIKQACCIINNERLPNASLITTLEPCILCTGAIITARIENVFYLCNDTRYSSINQILSTNTFNHKPKVIQCTYPNIPYEFLLKHFFHQKRKKLLSTNLNIH